MPLVLKWGRHEDDGEGVLALVRTRVYVCK